MKKQKGQAVVEFALILPFLLMLLFGIFVSGMLFADYMTLSNVARSSAREAALLGEGKYGDIRTEYKDKTKLLSSLYEWPGDQSTFQFQKGSLTNSVEVVITANLNKNFPGVSFLDSIGIGFPDKYDIKYTMHDETASADSN